MIQRPWRAALRGAVTLGAALILGACSEAVEAPPEWGPPPSPALEALSPTTSPAEVTPARRVVLISVDGLRADALAALGPAGAPGLHWLVTHGAATLNARPDPLRPYTLPGHTCMITGRPADGPYGHHYTGNRLSSQTVHDTAGGPVPSVFDVAHRYGRTTGLFASKPKFSVFVRAHLPPQGLTHPIDRVHITEKRDGATVQAAVQALRDPAGPTLLFVHLALPDSVGHRYGFDPQPRTAYRDAVRRTDAHLSRLLAHRPADVAVILTTDHGGHGHRHGQPDALDDIKLPFLVVGPGVAPGADLYALNGDRRVDPGALPAAGGEPIRNCEAGNLALALLGLPPIPGSLFGAATPLRLRPGG